MRAERVSLALLLLALVAQAAHADRQRAAGLLNNPFSRPDILEQPSAPRQAVAATPPETVELELTATLVSQTAPMAVVDGELIGIGERVRGLELIAVMEGKAVFARGARKFYFEVGGERPR